jgi:hypothetical protein
LQELNVNSAPSQALPAVQGTGYHTTNLAEHYVQSQLPADGGFVTAMDNLATTNSADREKDATLTKAIATLTDKLAEKDI